MRQRFLYRARRILCGDELFQRKQGFHETLSLIFIQTQCVLLI